MPLVTRTLICSNFLTYQVFLSQCVRCAAMFAMEMVYLSKRCGTLAHLQVLVFLFLCTLIISPPHSVSVSISLIHTHTLTHSSPRTLSPLTGTLIFTADGHLSLIHLCVCWHQSLEGENREY